MSALSDPDTPARPPSTAGEPAVPPPSPAGSSAAKGPGIDRPTTARKLVRRLVRSGVLAVFRVIYRVRPVGAANLPAAGGALLLPNHISYLDFIVLSAACRREVRFVVFDHYYSVWWVRPFLNLFGVVPISARRAKDAIKTVAAALGAGELICLFPEGQLSRTGCLNEIKTGFELMARRAGTPVVPVYFDRLWGSVFSFERGRFLTKRPHRVPFGVEVLFGAPLPAREATATRVREELHALSAQGLASRPALDTPLALALTKALLKAPWRPLAIGYSGDGSRRVLSRATALATAGVLATRWRDSIPTGRVGVCLPDSTPATVVRIALTLAGKTPVLIPLENPAGPRAMQQALESLGVSTVVTSARFPELLEDHWFPDDVIDFGAAFAAAPATSVFWESLRAYLTPAVLARKPWVGKPDGSGRRNGPPPTGSSPGAAFLRPVAGDATPHRLAVTCLEPRQVLAQVAQVGATNFRRDRDRFLVRLPTASAAGQLLGFFYPILHGIPTLHLPASGRLDPSAAAAAEAVTVTVTAPGQTTVPVGGPALRLALTAYSTPGIAPGPGDRPALLADDAAGVVISLSQADPVAHTNTALHQDGSRPGTFGRLLPGFAATAVGGYLNISGPATGDAPVAVQATTDPDGFVRPATPPPAASDTPATHA